MPIAAYVEEAMGKWRDMLAVGYEVAKDGIYTEDKPFKLPVDERILGLARLSDEDKARVVTAINRGLEEGGFANTEPAMGQEMARVERPEPPAGKPREGILLPRTMRVVTTDMSGLYDRWGDITDKAVEAAQRMDVARDARPRSA